MGAPILLAMGSGCVAGACPQLAFVGGWAAGPPIRSASVRRPLLHLGSRRRYLRWSRPRASRRAVVSDLDYAAAENLPDPAPVLGSILFVVLVTLAGIGFMEGRRGEARDAAMAVVKAYKRLEQLKEEAMDEEAMDERARLEEAKRRLADLRRLRVGTWDVELLPTVRQIGVAAEHHPSAMRNRGPILERLRALLPEGLRGRALEVASCSGAHLEAFAPAFPDLQWQPSDLYPAGSPQLRRLDENCGQRYDNVLPAVSLDASASWEQWPAAVRDVGDEFQLVFASNFVHCTPWTVTTGLLDGASKALRPGGSLVIYGPFKRDGRLVTENDAAFDKSLRDQSPDFGYRDVEEIVAQAQSRGLTLASQDEMPAANLLLQFVKQG